MRHKKIYTLSRMSVIEGTIPITPSQEYSLNVFLDGIAQSLGEEDLERLKFLCSGRGGIQKSSLSDVTTPLQLFKVLREKMIITNENLLTLQSMIWHINRKDLYRKFVDFCKGLDTTLYFYKPTSEPAKDYDYVKFHVSGYADKNIHYLRNLRTAVSKFLFCPEEYIYVRGIEETSSLYVTFMVPLLCIKTLLEFGKDDWDILKSFNVDQFVVHSLKKEIRNPLLPDDEEEEDHRKNPELQSVSEKIQLFDSKGVTATKSGTNEKPRGRRHSLDTILSAIPSNRPMIDIPDERQRAGEEVLHRHNDYFERKLGTRRKKTDSGFQET